MYEEENVEPPGGSIGPYGNKVNIGKATCTNLVAVQLEVVSIGLVMEIFDFLYNVVGLTQCAIAEYIGKLGPNASNTPSIRKSIARSKKEIQTIKKTTKNREVRMQQYLDSQFPWPRVQAIESPQKQKLKELKVQKKRNASLETEKIESETKVKCLENPKATVSAISMQLSKEKHNSITLQKENRQLEKVVKDLEKELSKSEANMERLVTKFDHVESDLEDYKEKLKEKERDLATIQRQLTKAQRQLTKAQRKLSHLNTRNVNKRVSRREKTIKSLEIENIKLQEEVRKAHSEVKRVSENLTQITHEAQQKDVIVNRLKEQLGQTRKEKRSLYKHAWYMDRKETKRKESKKKTYNEEYVQKLKQNMKMLDQRNKELEQLFALLESEEIETFHDGKYDDEVREVIMDLLCMNVGMNKVNEVIRTVCTKLAKRNIGRLPSNHVKSNILMEARFLADLEVAQAMKAGSDLKLVLGNAIHGDGTTKFHKKYQNFQVTLADGTQRTFACQPMGASDTDAVMECFDKRIQELADALHYTTSKGDAHERAALYASIKSTMTDQGPTMPQFSERLQSIRSTLLPAAYENWHQLPEDVQQTTKEFCTFYCKMHPIINFATECDKVLKGFEDVASSEKNIHTLLTSEAGVTRLVRTSSSAFHRRGSEKSGVEEFFTPYIQQEFDTKNYLVHYIGNRANILFEGSAAAYFHVQHMKSFLQLLPDTNHLLNTVREDLSEPIIIAELRALGIIHKVITDPFWYLIRNSPDVLSLNPILHKLQLSLQQFSEDATPLFTGQPIFSDDEAPIKKDVIYDSLFNAPEDPVQERMCIQALELLCSAMLLILERQCESQLPGGIYWDVDSTPWSNVPATNMVGERDFAILDLLVRLKPAARTVSLEALIMWAKNGTLAWLDSLDPQVKAEYMAEARLRSGSLIQKYRQRMADIKQQKWDALQEKHKEKKEKEKRQMVHALKLAKGVEQAPGGLWCTATAVQENLQQVEENFQIDTLHQQLLFLKTNLKCKGPKDYFTKSHLQKKYTASEMKHHLISIINQNNIPALLAELENQAADSVQPVPYISQEDCQIAHAQQKATLVCQIKAARQKRAVQASKEDLAKSQHKLIGRRIPHYCTEEGQTASEAD